MAGLNSRRPLTGLTAASPAAMSVEARAGRVRGRRGAERVAKIVQARQTETDPLGSDRRHQIEFLARPVRLDRRHDVTRA